MREPFPEEAADCPDLKGPSGSGRQVYVSGCHLQLTPPQAAYLRGPLSKLSQHLGPVVRDDAQRVVQQSHMLQTREAADAPDLLHLQGIPVPLL